MKNKIFLTLSFNIIFENLYSQQNLFNIPSGDITNTKKGFYQHQLNIYTDKLESKAHFVYGLGKGWDAGLNLVGKGFYFQENCRLMHNDNPNKGALYPVLMGSLQKQFKISERFDINLGSQLGFNLSSRIANKKINYFAYTIGIFHFMQHRGKLVGGLYQTNKMYVGGGNDFGVMAGYEIKLAKRWYLMGDWISGNNDASVSVIGGMFNLSKRIQLCAGWQIPNLNTMKPMGVVFEFNLMGWDMF